MSVRATGLITLILSLTLNCAGGAFQTVTGFAGRWAIHSGGKTLPFEMVYDTGSKGSVITEQFGKELSVFYQDRQDLMMIHFCNRGNQPRLRLTQGKTDGLLQFDAFDVSNLERKDAAHVQRIVYRILDEKTLDLEIVWEEDGSKTSEKYTLSRIQ